MTELKGFGTYFYPLIRFTNARKKVVLRDFFEEKIDEYFTSPFLEFSFNSEKVFINRDGFVFVPEDNRENATDILNAIFLSTSLLKHSVRNTYPLELTKMGINPATRKGTAHEIVQTSERGLIFFGVTEVFNPKFLNSDEFEIILDLAARIVESRFKTAVFTFYECYTEWDKGKHTSSFLFGWMTIESYLSKKLEEFFVEKGVFQTLKNKLNDEWTVSKKLRYLKTENRITKDDFKVYDKLRVIRNRIIHSEYRPTSDEAEECKLTANDNLKKFEKVIIKGVFEP